MISAVLEEELRSMLRSLAVWTHQAVSMLAVSKLLGFAGAGR